MVGVVKRHVINNIVRDCFDNFRGISTLITITDNLNYSEKVIGTCEWKLRNTAKDGTPILLTSVVLTTFNKTCLTYPKHIFWKHHRVMMIQKRSVYYCKGGILYKVSSFRTDRTKTWPPWKILVSGWIIHKNHLLWNCLAK